ncbi:MAG: methyltransferase domain-containing protein [Rhodospirillaceae bacterium]|nr:methyltransferase domain-containing protein [Rhodospirillaceae bacterium]
MTKAESGRMHAYYEAKGLSPTFGNLRTPEELDRHVAMRERIFIDKLNVVPQLFAGARALEFGPDTGENALVFARWGATVDLVEPNRQVWPQIEAYFRHFGLADRLGTLDDSSIQQFRPSQTYDVAVAEGFIQTVQPSSTWIGTVAHAIAPGGMLILFYYERASFLVELFHRAAHRRFGHLVGGAGLDSARRLYEAKWNTIPHVRRFESWVMDVLDNPYSSIRYTLDASQLVAELADAGFRFYQSWPRYRDELRMGWHKAMETTGAVVAEIRRQLPRLAVAHATGRSLFAYGPDREVADLGARIDRLLTGLEAAADEKGEPWPEIADGFAALGRAVGDPALLYAPDDATRTEARASLDALAALSRLLAGGEAAAIAAFASTDAAFLRTWGQPAHYAVFRRLPDAPGGTT